jgi:hypothetical protein
LSEKKKAKSMFIEIVGSMTVLGLTVVLRVKKAKYIFIEIVGSVK